MRAPFVPPRLSDPWKVEAEAHAAVYQLKPCPDKGIQDLVNRSGSNIGIDPYSVCCLFLSVFQDADGVEYRNQGNAHISKNSLPHICCPGDTQSNKNKLNAQGKKNVLPDHISCFLGHIDG